MPFDSCAREHVPYLEIITSRHFSRTTADNSNAKLQQLLLLHQHGGHIHTIYARNISPVRRLPIPSSVPCICWISGQCAPQPLNRDIPANSRTLPSPSLAQAISQHRSFRKGNMRLLLGKYFINVCVRSKLTTLRLLTAAHIALP